VRWRGTLHEGIAALDGVMPELLEFERATGAPAPVSAGWARAAAMAGRGEPWVVLMRSRDDELVGAASLLDTGRSTIVRPSVEASDTPFQLAVPSAAAEFAAWVLRLLRAGGRPWRLDLSGLPHGDPVAGAIAASAPAARHEQAAPVRRLEVADHRRSRTAITPPARRALAAASRQMHADGVVPALAATTHATTVLDAVSAIAGDHQWRHAACAHAARGEIELTTIRLSGAVAAQALALLDEPVYRVLGGFANPRWTAYAPTVQVGASMIARSIADSRYARIEWSPSSPLGPPDPHCPAVATWRLIAQSA
jgi:hypothetical protein